MIRIEYDDISNPNYIQTKWVEESESHMAMLGRTMIPRNEWEEFKDLLSDTIKEKYEFIQRIPK